MPKVQCPSCPNSVILTTRLGHAFQVSGLFDPSICIDLKDAADDADDPMECPTLEVAVEKCVAEFGEGERAGSSEVRHEQD